jgi:hypothetical protein
MSKVRDAVEIAKKLLEWGESLADFFGVDYQDVKAALVKECRIDGSASDEAWGRGEEMLP